MSFFNVKKIIHMYLNSNLLYFYSWFLIHLNLYYKQYIAYDLYFYWSCYWFRLAYVMMHVILHFIVLYIFMYIKHDVSFYWYIFYFEFNLKKKIYICIHISAVWLQFNRASTRYLIVMKKNYQFYFGNAVFLPM